MREEWLWLITAEIAIRTWKLIVLLSLALCSLKSFHNKTLNHFIIRHGGATITTKVLSAQDSSADGVSERALPAGGSDAGVFAKLAAD